MMKNILIPLYIIFIFQLGFAQQTVKGVIIDKDSQLPIPFATVVLQDTDPLKGGSCDLDGNFRLENVEIGQYTLAATYLGYEPFILPNLEVTAGKEVVLTIEMTESFETLEEVVVKANADRSANVNELATISTRSLSIEEANRYAASFADPARQAQNFAGVVNNGDDLSNDIVIRGNSPSGLLWRLEGIEIPNPNHFASLGSSGGAISMLSSNVLTTSDFYTAAFPAEYGNATAGVFDLRFRKGNRDKRETTIGAGFLGLELASEGPFKKSGDASYLFNYRYSTLSILSNLGFKLAGDFLPSYQDLSFNVNLPTEKAGVFNVFGLGGNSWANFREQNEENSNLFESSKEQSVTAIAGIKHTYFLKDKGYFKSVLMFSKQTSDNEFSLEFNNVITPEFEEFFDANTFRFSSFYNRKFNIRHTIRTGIVLSNLQQTFRTKENQGQQFNTTNDLNGNAVQFQAFTHWKWRIKEQLTLNSGLHYLHYGLTNAHAIEPRIGLKWKLNERNSFNIGAGLHSRAENLTIYLIEDKLDNGTIINRNENLGLSKSAHFVVGYDRNINKNTRLKIEGYYQHLYDTPVSADTTSNFSAVNANGIFEFLAESDTALVNRGSGRNYGVELTLERFLDRGFYYLATLSLYQSEFSLAQKAYFNTRFNGNYILNVLVGKEFQVGEAQKNIFGLNAKFILTGGQRFTGVNESQSILQQETVFSNTPFGEQIDTYYRFDVGINYRWNRKKTSHTLSLNVQNATNRLNEFSPETFYNPQQNKVITQTQQQTGLVPILKYQFNF